MKDASTLFISSITSRFLEPNPSTLYSTKDIGTLCLFTEFILFLLYSSHLVNMLFKVRDVYHSIKSLCNCFLSFPATLHSRSLSSTFTIGFEAKLYAHAKAEAFGLSILFV